MTNIRPFSSSNSIASCSDTSIFSSSLFVSILSAWNTLFLLFWFFVTSSIISLNSLVVFSFSFLLLLMISPAILLLLGSSP
jgi:hypothetical protein